MGGLDLRWGELRAGIHIPVPCVDAVKDLRDCFLFLFTSGLKEFIKCSTIVGLLVYMSYKQYEPYNRVLFFAIGYAHRQETQ